MIRLTLLLCAAMVFALYTAGQDSGQLRPGLAKAEAEGRLDEVWAEARAREAAASGAEGAFVLDEPEPEPLSFPDPEEPVVLAQPVEPDLVPDLVVEPAREVVQAVSDPVFSLESFGNEPVPGADAARTGVVIDPEAAVLPEILPEAEPEEEPVAIADASGNVWYVRADSVNVRAEPSTEAAILGKLSTGEALLLVAVVDAEWVRIVVEGDGIEGYVASRFLSSAAP